MFTRLERNAYAVLVMMALCAAVVLASPAPAQAQAASTTEDTRNAHANLARVVVRPGDSLWSISEERLGPNAAPQRILNGAAQIYVLNRERIGPDPNLILVGRELLVPPTMSEQPTGAAPAHKTAGAAEAGPSDRVTKSMKGKAPSTAPGGAAAKGGEARKPAAAPVAGSATLPALPDVAVAAPVPAVGSLASNGSPLSPVASFLRTIRTEFASAASALAVSFFEVSADARAEGRWLLGLGVLVLTLLVAVLMALKLPMRRTTRRDAERWGTSSGYYGETPAASRITPFIYHPGSLGGSLGDRDEQDARQQAPGALGHERRAVLTGSGDVSASSRARKADAAAVRGRTPKAKAVPRNGLALGAHNPKVRRAPRRAHATMRARKLRPRRGVSRRPRPPVALGQIKGVSTRDGH